MKINEKLKAWFHYRYVFRSYGPLSTYFTSHINEQIAPARMPMLHSPALVLLTKGLALQQGGGQWKIRLPLLVNDSDIALPEL